MIGNHRDRRFCSRLCWSISRSFRELLALQEAGEGVDALERAYDRVEDMECDSPCEPRAGGVISAAGIDSWSPCWYVDRESTAAVMYDEVASVPAARGMLVPEPIAGHRVG